MRDLQDLKAQIESIENLPTIPSILKSILTSIEDPKISLNEIGTIISNDPVLTSRVLRVVNSPIYGFSGRISSLSQALLLLGLNVVRGMLFGVTVFEAMERSIIGLWGHSIGCAITAGIIARRKELEEPEEVSVAGLLHDFGKVVLGLKFPDEYRAVADDAAQKELLIAEAEQPVFGITHANAGAWIARKWNFPPGLVEVIGYHHKPQLAKKAPLQTAVVHLADILIRARGFGNAGDPFVPAVEPSVWQSLSLSADELREILREMDSLLAHSDDFLKLDE